jgi:hypothetical protein
MELAGQTGVERYQLPDSVREDYASPSKALLAAM